MHNFLNEIKKHEGKPYVVKDFLNKEEIKLFQKLYHELPIEVDNKRQKIIKKKWSTEFNKELQNKYSQKLKKIIGSYEMDNPETKEGSKSLGLFQESYMPVTLHVDTGFDFEKIIYKQTLLPLSSIGETIIFKNRFYGCSTTFSINPTGPLILYSISPFLRRPAEPFFNKPKFSIKGFLNSFKDFASGVCKKSELI